MTYPDQLEQVVCALHAGDNPRNNAPSNDMNNRYPVLRMSWTDECYSQTTFGVEIVFLPLPLRCRCRDLVFYACSRRRPTLSNFISGFLNRGNNRYFGTCDRQPRHGRRNPGLYSELPEEVTKVRSNVKQSLRGRR